MFRKSLLLCLTVALNGCSSPPEPVAVKWDAPSTVVNSTLPEWNENHVVNPAPNVKGTWSRVVRDFSEDTPYGFDIYYAIAHSSFIKVSTNNTDAFFNAKRWLQTHGAKGVIRFENNKSCITCKGTTLSLSHGIKPDAVMVKNSKAMPNNGSYEENKPGILSNAAQKKPLQQAAKQKEKPSTTKINSTITEEKTFVVNTPRKPDTQILAGSRLQPHTSVKKPPPVTLPVWRGEVGSTLKDTVFRWSASQSCTDGGNWRVIWETSLDYRIDAPLSFSGDFKAALNGIFSLYQHAQKPLYAAINTSQCLIKVTDK